MEKENNAIPFRPLGIVKEALEEIGIEISYAYDDLMFVDHNHFLLQFGETGNVLFFYGNKEESEEDSNTEFETVTVRLAGRGIQLLKKGKYSMVDEGDGNINISFYEH